MNGASRSAAARERPASLLHRSGIIALMAVGGLAIWIGNPLLWMWVTSRLESGTQPTMGPYALLLLGVVLTAVALAKGLSALNRRYQRVTGTTPTVHVIVPWRRSARGGRSQEKDTDGRLPVGVLDVIMVLSVALAVTTFVVWYVATDPTPPNVGGPGPAKH